MKEFLAFNPQSLGASANPDQLHAVSITDAGKNIAAGLVSFEAIAARGLLIFRNQMLFSPGVSSERTMLLGEIILSVRIAGSFESPLLGSLQAQVCEYTLSPRMRFAVPPPLPGPRMRTDRGEMNAAPLMRKMLTDSVSDLMLRHSFWKAFRRLQARGWKWGVAGLELMTDFERSGLSILEVFDGDFSTLPGHLALLFRWRFSPARHARDAAKVIRRLVARYETQTGARVSLENTDYIPSQMVYQTLIVVDPASMNTFPKELEK